MMQLSSARPVNVDALPEKERLLRLYLRDRRELAIAYSGGVDSSYLAVVATQEIGAKALCIIGVSPSVSSFQMESAIRFAEKHGLNLKIVETSEGVNPEYVANNPDRCFHCKSELYSVLALIPDGHGAILDGTNADDLNDFRPGRKAASEKGVVSPLAELGFSKAEIRELSRRLGLETWDIPASPCLASRIAHGTEVTPERLMMVEQAEAVLRSLDFREFRVRVHDEMARLEIAKEEFHKALDGEVLGRIKSSLKQIGFRFVTLDLEGFRSGSMNPTVEKKFFNIKR
jgi:uncharacterized protein